MLISFKLMSNGGRVSDSSWLGMWRVIVESLPFCDFIEYILYSVGIVGVEPKRNL